MPITGHDHAAIVNLFATYCLTLDHDEIDRCVELFTEDGSFEVYGHTFQGREKVRKMMVGAPGGLHLGGPAAIDSIEGDVAHTRQNLLFVERESGVMRRAVYTDEVRRVDGEWRIHRRRCQFIVPGGLADRPDEDD